VAGNQHSATLSVHEQLDRLDGRLDDPMDVLAGIKPDMRGHDGHQRVRDRPERLHSHAFALEVYDSANPVPRKQLLAANSNR
jgi:hypothetical protein